VCETLKHLSPHRLTPESWYSHYRGSGVFYWAIKMKIKNWSKFQHFKDRRPLWIKLYRDLLDDRLWNELDPLSSKVLVTLWLLASEDAEMEGNLPDIKTIAWRMRMSEKQVTECVIKLSHWLEQDGIELISSGYQSDAPEKRRDREEKETKKEIEAPEGVSLEVWESFVKQRKARRAQITEKVMETISREARNAGWSLDAALNEIVVRNWQSFKAEWVADKQNQTETVYQRSMRLKMQEAVPSIAKQAPYQDASDFFRTIDMDSQKVIEVNK
jgi:hypothetical protein